MKRLFNNLLHRGYLPLLAVFLCLIGSTGQAWAAKAYVEFTPNDATYGLVYASTSKTEPLLSAYSAGPINLSGSNYGWTVYSWAKPARGYYIKKGDAWSGYKGQFSSATTAPSAVKTGNLFSGYKFKTEYADQSIYRWFTSDGPTMWDGVADAMYLDAGGGQDTYTYPKAKFVAAPSYTVKYELPVGGEFTVTYQYRKIVDGRFKETTEVLDWSNDQDGFVLPEGNKTYGEDVITFSTTAVNFNGWYEDGELISTDKTFTYKATKNATIRGDFKSCSLGTPSGAINYTENALDSYDKVITVPVNNVIGNWEASNFTVTFTEQNGSRDDIQKGTIAYSAGTLTIPYTYHPTSWGGTDVLVNVKPDNMEAIEFTISALAKQVFAHEAQVEINGVVDRTGTLAEMLAYANTLDSKPTLRLTQDKTINAPLSFTKSMTFELDGNTLTSNGIAAFSIDAAGVDVHVEDNSFSHTGIIKVEKNYAGVISIVNFTAAAKLTLIGGTMTIENTATGNASAKAYGINVSNGAVFYMIGGTMTIASEQNAYGVYVASATDYATIEGGTITVSVNSNAYGVWSAGQSNITRTPIAVEAKTATNAYGLYVNGGVTTITDMVLKSDAKTSNAYGAYVKAGRLNYNGGSIAVNAPTSNAIGVNIEAGAIAMVQQRAQINALTAATAIGVSNKGTALLYNAIVTAKATSTPATAVDIAATATSTTIEEGTYFGDAGTTYAYGLHHQGGELNVDGGTFRGITRAGDNAYGMRSTKIAQIKNATIWGETQGTGKTAYGFVADEAAANITLANCDITAKSVTSAATAIHSRATVLVEGDNITTATMAGADAKGFVAESGNNTLNNLTATINSYTTGAYGIDHKAGVLTVNGGNYNVIAQQAIGSAAESKAYGLLNAASCTATLTNATFNVQGISTANSQNVYGVYASGTVNSTNCTYRASARKSAYGFYAKGAASILNLARNNVRAETTVGETSRAIYSEGTFTIDGDVLEAVAKTTDSYAIHIAAGTLGTVLDGKFKASGTSNFGPISAAGTAGKMVLKGGFYATETNLPKYLASGYQVYTVDATQPEHAEGYRFVIADHNPSPYVCRIGTTGYATLEAALQYANDNSATECLIIMTQPYTLPAGDYVLPAKAKLLIPRNGDDAQIEMYATRHTDVDVRREFLRLTMAENAILNVKGTIEVSSMQYCPANAATTSYVASSYGHLYMENGSQIVLNGGANLYAWGYVTGKGSIKALDGSNIKELFLVTDMKGALSLASYNNNAQKAFPITQYYIQNIEVATMYYHGASLIADFGAYYNGAGGILFGDRNIKLVGTEDAMFLITEDNEATWVRKTYDAARDRIVWDVNSAAKISSMSLEINVPGVGNYPFDSKNYVLPLTNNMTIHILDGNLDITQDTRLQPGCEIEINKTASLSIAAGKKLSVVDAETVNYTNSESKPATYNTNGITAVPFSPSWSGTSSPRKSAGTASINVHGNIFTGGADTKGNIGGIFTTSKGANIFSTNADAGTIVFESKAPANATLYSISGTEFPGAMITSAQLKNGNGTYTATTSAVEGHSYVYMNNAWVETFTDGCFESIDGVFYAKPAGYVALKNTASVDDPYELETDEHLYVTTDDKLLIRQDDCQWWEVTRTATDGVFQCTKDGYEGFYNYNEDAAEWQLVKRDVTFYSDEAGTQVLKVIETNYMGIPDQSVISENPTKAETAQATYQFRGWKSSVSDEVYHWSATLEQAENSMSYTPVFDAVTKHYTVSLKDALNGQTVPLEVAYGEKPEYVPAKAKDDNYTYTFSHWLAADNTTTYASTADMPVVTGKVTYTAIWNRSVNTYTVVWKDGDQTLSTQVMQPYNAATTYQGALLPSKEADDRYEYTFAGWVSSIDGETYANGATPKVTGDVVYTANYNTTSRYMITFANYNGDVLQKEAVTENERPVYAGTPRREPDRDGYYNFNGWKDLDGNVYAVGVQLPAATERQTYTAQFTYVTTVYTVTFRNFDGNNGVWSERFGEGVMPSYDGGEIAKVSDNPAADYWEFTGWTPEVEAVSATSVKDYTANFERRDRKYTITFVYDGYGNSIKKEYVYGATPTYDTSAGDPAPRKDDEGEYSYTFKGWNTTFAPVTGDATYTALFNQVEHQYKVTFVLNNGEENVVQMLTLGAMPTPPTPTKATDAQWIYTFNGWDKEVTAVVYDITYTAQWNQTGVPYNVTFVDEDGSTVLKAIEAVAHGSKPVAPANPSKAPVGENFYKFDSWTMSTDGGANYEGSYTAATIPTVGTSNVIYKAVYTTIVPEALVIVGENVTPYESFATALSNVTNGATLKLMKNVSRGNNTTTFDKNLTLDLNGKELSATAASKFVVSANVIIQDNSENHDGWVGMNGSANAAWYGVQINNGGTLTLESGIIQVVNTNTGSSARAIAVDMKGGTFNINGGKVYAEGAYRGYTIYQESACIVNMTSGVVEVNISGSNHNAYGMYITNNSAQTNISGGDITVRGTSATVVGVYNNNGTLSISGGRYYVNAGSNTPKILYTSKAVSGGYYSTNSNISAASGKAIVNLTSAHPEYANGYRYVVETAHKLTWNKNNGESATGSNLASGTPIAQPADPVKDGYEFTGWKLNGEQVDFNEPIYMSATANMTFEAQWELIPTVEEKVELPAGETTVSNLIVKTTGDLEIPTSASINVTGDLVLEATQTTSGQLNVDGNLVVSGNCYFDLELGMKTANTPARTWFSVAVPWKVDAATGIIADGKQLTLIRDVDVLRYNGATRAQNGANKSAWEYVQAGETMNPGTLYFIAFATQYNTIRFVKKSGEEIIFSGDMNVAVNASMTGNGMDGGWNAIANPALYHATMDVNEATIAQVLVDGSIDNGARYDNFNLATDKLVVGKPVFVQVGAGTDGTVEINKVVAAGVAARRVAAKTDFYDVRIVEEGAEKYSDRVFVKADEDAMAEYTIGADLVKMGTTNKVAQMWVPEYNAKLCVHTALLANNVATMPLAIYAPKDGDYTLTLGNEADRDIYLTYNGAVIANLSLGEYTLSLTKGTATGYGLRIGAYTGTATDLDEAAANAKNGIEKVIINNKVFIIRDGRVFDAVGQLVK